MAALNLTIEDKIAVLEFDQPDSAVNVLSTDIMKELDAILEELKEKPKDELAALIIVSKKKDIFIAGADIREIEKITTPKEAMDKSEGGKGILSKLSGLRMITIAMINGACLGGGFELALACNYRVAGFSQKIKIGLPEVNLGIIPGFGGTQRLPRLVGLRRALGMILTGQIITSKEALKYGVVDRLFPGAKLLEETKDFARGLLDKTIEVKKRKDISQFILEGTFLGKAIIFKQAKKELLKKTKGFYPAPLEALNVIKRTFGRDIKKGFALESETFSNLAITDVSKNLIKVFFLNEKYKKFPWVDEKIKPALIKKCGIVGAGVMGGGIAQLLSYNDIPTRLKDINYGALQTALKTASSLYDYLIKKRKFKVCDVDYKFGLISPTITYGGFENTDFVIEAVVEDLEIKKKVFSQLDRIVSQGAILASNTSSLPIIEIAKETKNPDRVIGLHFFNPVHRMPLVEVIKSDKTSDQAISTTISLARRLGKVVIVVKDVTGFLINRILLNYLNEAGYLVEEGVPIERVDAAGRRFGMPMGPIELVDEIGIDVGYKVAKILEDAYGPRMQVSPPLERIKDKGLLGKKTNRGFYIHKGKKKTPNPDICRIFKSPKGSNISDDILVKRLIYVMINEAGRCLEEGVADSPATIDIGMIMGTGFPPFRAGLLRYADTVGVGNIANDLKGFEKEKRHERFRACRYLLDRREKGFYL